MAEIRVILVGKTGVGKSSLGNTLLGREVFHVFRGLSSGTPVSQWADLCLDWINLHVIDTPGLWGTHLSADEVLLEIDKGLALTCPGPHIVILVIRCGDRFTREHYDVAKEVLALFGDGVRGHLLIVFTGGDCLEVPIDEMQKALEQHIIYALPYLKEILCAADNRYCVVDNTGSFEVRKQHAQVVFRMMQELLRNNNGNYYPNERIDQYSKRMQTAIAYSARNQHLSKGRAAKEMKKRIVEGEERSLIFHDYNIALLGMTGSGKSSLGNTLLCENKFVLQAGLSSGTKTSQWAESTVDKIHLMITDVPGLSDTHLPKEFILKETAKSLTLLAPGPHAILFVVRLDSPFTKVEYNAYMKMKELFTHGICRFMIVVFTHMDFLKPVPGKRQDRLRAEVKNASDYLRQLLHEVDDRYIGIENSAPADDKRQQRKDLISIVQEVYRKNGGQFFAVPKEIDAIVKQMVESRTKQDGCTKEEATRSFRMDVLHEALDIISKITPIVQELLGLVSLARSTCVIL